MIHCDIDAENYVKKNKTYNSLSRLYHFVFEGSIPGISSKVFSVFLQILLSLRKLRLNYLLGLIDRASKIKTAWKKFHHNLNAIKIFF